MVLRNPISSIRQSRIMAQSPMRGGGSPMMGGAPPPSPIRPGQGGFRNLNLGGGPRGPVGPQINFDMGGEDIEQDVPVRPPQDEASRFYEEMERLRQQAGPGLSAYREALNQVPNREEYKPNWLTRIAAGLSGFSAGMRDPGEGIQVAQDLNASKYRSAMADYSNRLGTLKEQADIEQEDMKLQVAALKSAREMGLKYEDYLLKKQDTESQITARDVTAKAAMKRAEAYAAAQSRPGYDTFPQEDGSVLYQNKNDKNDSFIVPGHTVAAAVMRTGQQNARTAAGQLGVARDRLTMDQSLEPRRVAAAEANAGANAYRALNPPKTGQNNVFITPSAQKTARELAETELLSDPYWGGLLGRRENGYFNTLSDDEQKTLEEEIQDRANEIMQRQRGGG